MSDDGPSSRNVERAVLLVGGLALFLWGVQSGAGVLTSFYDAFVPGPAPGSTSNFWVNESVALIVALLFLFAGVFLLLLAWRVHRALRAEGH